MNAKPNQNYIITYGGQIINAYVNVVKTKVLKFTNVDTNEVHWIGINDFERNIIE